ncbi:TetR/AcrR family transcriptional regulator [Streptomyces sp. NPDC055078]
MTETGRGGPAGTAPGHARRPKDRRATITRVAAGLFARDGYAATGMSDIAERVGVTPGAIYRHFNDKDDLLRTVLEDALAEFTAAITPRPRIRVNDADARLRYLVRGAVALTLSRPDAIGTYLRERASLSATSRGELHARELQVTEIMSAAVRQACPGLTRAQTKVRLRALSGVLALLARWSTRTVPGPRRQALFTRSLLALVRTPADLTPLADRPPAPVRPAAPGWARPRSRRQEIRDLAAPLFRRHGYHGVRMDQIGEAVGISGTTVYGTYRRKAEILVDGCDLTVTRTEAAVDQALAAARSAPEALRLVTRSYSAAVFAAGDMVAVAAREGGALPRHDRARIRGRQADVRQVCADVLVQVRGDLERTDACVLVAAANEAVQVMAVMRRGRPTEAAAGELMLRLLLGGHDS